MKKRRVLADLFLLLMVAGLYTVTSLDANVRSVMAPIYRGRGEAAAILCTVSWNAAALTEILDTLSVQDVRVTFAVSGGWARENPALLLRMAEAGHEFAVLGDDPAFDGSLSQVQADVSAALAAVADVTGRTPRYYYSGNRNAAVSGRAARRLGVRQILCTADLTCARGTAADIVQRAEDAAMEGCILLAQPTAAFAEALPALLTKIQTKGWRVVPVGGVLDTT